LLSCSKYEQGSNFNLTSKLNRLSNKWLPGEVYLPNNFAVSFPYQGSIEFKKDGRYLEYTGIDSIKGTWEFSPSKTILNIETDLFITFEILKLSKKELWFIDPIENREYHLIAEDAIIQ
jgi:hypothetical protein